MNPRPRAPDRSGAAPYGSHNPYTRFAHPAGFGTSEVDGCAPRSASWFFRYEDPARSTEPIFAAIAVMTPELAQAIDGVFIYMADLLERIERNEAIDRLDERSAFLSLLQTGQQRLGAREDWPFVQYALVAWIDDLLSDIEWSGKDRWNYYRLEFDFYQSRESDTGFFHKAGEAATRGLSDALEVCFICVMLGFRGFFREADAEAKAKQLKLPHSLPEWIKRTVAILRRDPAIVAAARGALPNGRTIDVPLALDGRLEYRRALGRLAATGGLWSAVSCVELLFGRGIVPAATGLSLAAGMSGGALWSARQLRQSTTSPWAAELRTAFQSGWNAIQAVSSEAAAWPVFLVLGLRDRKQAQSLFAQAAIQFRLEGLPESGPLLFGLGDFRNTADEPTQGIWIAPLGGDRVGCLAAKRAEVDLQRADQPHVGHTPGGSESARVPGASSVQQSFPQSPSSGMTFVTDSDSLLNEQAHDDAVPLAAVPTATVAFGGAQAAAAIHPREPTGSGGGRNSGGSSRLPGTSIPRSAQVQLSAAEDTDQGARLAALCELLQTVREPAHPVSGVLSVVPFGFLTGHREQVDELIRAVARDLAGVQLACGLRVPILGLIGGCEVDPGFRELMRRFGLTTAHRRRFGQGLPAGALVDSVHLSALVNHLCGMVDDWTLRHFQERDGLVKSGNIHLYAFLARLRSIYRPELHRLITRGYGGAADLAALTRDSDHESRLAASRAAPASPAEVTPVELMGIYFAATGETSDRQGFARSTFEKLQTDAPPVEWLPGTLIRDSRLARAAALLRAACYAVIPLFVLLSILWANSLRG